MVCVHFIVDFDLFGFWNLGINALKLAMRQEISCCCKRNDHLVYKTTTLSTNESIAFEVQPQRTQIKTISTAIPTIF